MNIIRLFEERLEVSRGNAIWRVIASIFLSASFIAIIACAGIFFPYTASFREEIPLLHGNHTEVSKVNADVVVDKDNFIKIMKDKTLVSLNGDTITYMTKSDGMSYCYEDIVSVGRRYHIQSQRIQGGLVVREIKLRKFFTVVFQIIAPLLGLFVLSRLIDNAQGRRVSGYGSSAVYKNVWIDRM